MMANIKTYPTLAHDFGYILRVTRYRLNLSEQKLAERSGLNEVDGADVIKRLELGAELPNLEILVALAQGLGMSPGALLAETLWKATDGYLFDDSEAQYYGAPCIFRAGYYTKFGGVALYKNAYDRFSPAFNDSVHVLNGHDAAEPQFIAVYVQTGLLRLHQNETINYRWVRDDDGGCVLMDQDTAFNLATGRVLRDHRESRGLSVTDLAKMSGAPESRIEQIEAASISAGALDLARLAIALNTPVERFLDRIDAAMKGLMHG